MARLPTEPHARRLRELTPVLKARLARLVPRVAVDDLVQDALAAAVAHNVPLDEEERLLGWLTVVARRRAIDWLRRNRRPVDPRLVPLPEDARDHAPHVVDRIVLEAALALLPEAHRRVVVDVCVRGQTTAEVADALGVPVGTVRSRLHYGLATLRSLIDADHATSR